MGCVDRAEQKIWNLLNCHRTNLGQYFLYVFELTMVNACVARLKRHPATFRNGLITGLTASYFRPVKRIGRPIALAAEDRLSEHNHKLVPIPGWNCKFESNSEDCKVCSDKGQVAGQRHRTTARCNKCPVAMCAYPCFDWYHTLLNYQTCYKNYGNG